MYLSWDAAPDLSFSEFIHFITDTQENNKQYIVFISLEAYHFTKENSINAHLSIASKSGLIQLLLKKGK